MPEPENRGVSPPGSFQSQLGPRPTVIIQQPGFFSRFRSWLLTLLLAVSLVANFMMYAEYHNYFANSEGPTEVFHSGDRDADDKLALIKISGTIMPPFTERILKTIDKAREDKHIKGVLLAVDSPGGMVADSHQIYHRLKKLSAEKPVVVSMGSLAASGGYFVAMGAGSKAKIFAQPTTWTGSIGVIIPHYEVTAVAEKVGFKALPLKTGEFKDSLSPFREMTERDKALWDNILNQSFDLFLQVIDENRDTLDMAQTRALATGQIYTAQDAKNNGMVDEIGFEEDAIDALKKMAGVTTARVVAYPHALGLFDVLAGSAKASDPTAQWRNLMEMTVPRALYYCSWGLPLPAE